MTSIGQWARGRHSPPAETCTDRPTLTPQQQAQAQRIYDVLPQVADIDRRDLAEPRAATADAERWGATEFHIREAVHRLGAKALETALQGRKKRLRWLQPHLLSLPPSRPFPAAAVQDVPKCRRGRPPESRLLLLPAGPPRPLSLGPSPAADVSFPRAECVWTSTTPPHPSTTGPGPVPRRPG